MDIKTIPMKDLLKDKAESIQDVQDCTTALKVGVTTYSGGSVQERLDVNQSIVVKIDNEIKRREEAERNAAI